MPVVEMVIEGRERPITIPMDIRGDSQIVEGMLLNENATYEQERVVYKKSMYVNQRLTMTSGQLKGTSYEQPVQL